jgi:hypothetical protein
MNNAVPTLDEAITIFILSMSVYWASHSQDLLSHQPISFEEYARFYAIQTCVKIQKQVSGHLPIQSIRWSKDGGVLPR